MTIETFSTPLDLELGGQINDPKLAYSTYGTLNEQKDNAIVVCHALTANSEVHDWWSGLFGAGRVFDPNEYFILCINNLGSPYGSSSPKDKDENGERWGLNFPAYTLRDTATLHIRLLDELGIDKIHLLMGGSCGGNIAQEMAYVLGDRVGQLILLCCSVSESPWLISIHESQRLAMKADHTFTDNHDDAGQGGLKGARAFALPFYRSHPAFKIRQAEDDVNKVDDFKASSYVRYQGEKFVKRYDAHCYYTQLNALDTHNMARNRESARNALGQIKASTLCIGFSSDLLIPTLEQKNIAAAIPNATYKEVDTQFGHDAFLIETDRIQQIIDEWKATAL